MSQEIEIPQHKEPQQESGAKSTIGALALSVIIHGAVLLLVGGYVIFEGVVPKTVFNQVDGMVDANADEMVMPPPPDEITEMPDKPQPTEDLTPTTVTNAAAEPLGSDIIISSAPSTTFNLAPTTGVTSITTASQNIGKPSTTSVGNPSGKASVVQFFGIKAEARRVAFLLDASGSMVVKEKGGKTSYENLKNELVRMVQNLDSTSEFNVFIFDSTVDAFKPRAVIASERYKADFAKWIAPYMTTTFGNILKNYDSKRLAGFTGLTRMELALTGAFESGCDTIFILSDGTPQVKRPGNAKEIAEWEALRKKNEKEIAQFQADSKTYNEKNKVLIAEMLAEVKRQNESLVGRQKEWIWWIDGYKGLPPRPTAPPGTYRPSPNFTNEEILNYLAGLYEELYKARGQDRPNIHVVGYSVGAKDKEFLQQLAKKFGGNYRDFKP